MIIKTRQKVAPSINLRKKPKKKEKAEEKCFFSNQKGYIQTNMFVYSLFIRLVKKELCITFRSQFNFFVFLNQKQNYKNI